MGFYECWLGYQLNWRNIYISFSVHPPSFVSKSFNCLTTKPGTTSTTMLVGFRKKCSVQQVRSVRWCHTRYETINRRWNTKININYPKTITCQYPMMVISIQPTIPQTMMPKKIPTNQPPGQVICIHIGDEQEWWWRWRWRWWGWWWLSRSWSSACWWYLFYFDFFLFEFRGLHCSSRLFGLRPGWAVRGYKQMEIAMWRYSCSRFVAADSISVSVSGGDRNDTYLGTVSPSSSFYGWF